MKLSKGEWISRCIECFIDIDVPKLQAKVLRRSFIPTILYEYVSIRGI
jgi:hypothetical protein